jgi:hypothetical protein
VNVEADELLRQVAHRETALRLELGPDDPREANPSYPAVFGAMLLRSRRMLSVGLAKQNAEAVIRGYKRATLSIHGACCPDAGGLGASGRHGARAGGSWCWSR